MRPKIYPCSATSVDVEEHLYRLATNMGITVITSSQVSARITPHDNVKFLMMANCSVHVLKDKKKMANCCLLSNGCPKIDTLLSGMDSDLAELFCVYRGLL